MRTKAETIRETTANKGEWAELYVFLKLLGEGRLYAADSNLNKREDSYLDVLRILREEVAGIVMSYSREGEPGTVEIYTGDQLMSVLPAKLFLDNAVEFFEHLSTAKPPIGPTEGVADLTEQINVKKYKTPGSKSLKAIVCTGGKTDIVIKLRDSRNSLVTTMGFSIKSQFGQAPTLFNAGTSAQMNYRMEGMDDIEAAEFNALVDDRGKRKWAECRSFIEDHGIRPVFIGSKHATLDDNLEYIRESMPAFWAYAIKVAILAEDQVKKVSEICRLAERENPLGYKHIDLYEKVFKDFLFAAFSGMTAGLPWNGAEQVNGGYIVVKDDGEVLCYHANDREAFRDYLFNSTHLEYVSCGKYGWGYVEKDKDGRWVLPAMASVRFYKRL